MAAGHGPNSVLLLDDGAHLHQRKLMRAITETPRHDAEVVMGQASGCPAASSATAEKPEVALV